MFNFLPKFIEPDMIPALRSRGRKVRFTPSVVIHGDKWYPVESEQGRKLIATSAVPNIALDASYEPPLSLKEIEVQKRITSFLADTLGLILADGVKLFSIPDELIEPLNEIAIPLTPRDFSMPFDAVVVKHRDEYHYVLKVGDHVSISVVDDKGTLDYTAFLVPDKPMEVNLSGGQRSPGEIDLSTDEKFHSHRFRATLNYLLFATMEGISTETVRLPPKLKRNPNARIACPTSCAPQNIKLWKKRYGSMLTPELGVGEVSSGKRPHWRRAHWKRVACGKGWTEHKLKFIRASFINRNRIADLAETLYTASVK